MKSLIVSLWLALLPCCVLANDKTPVDSSEFKRQVYRCARRAWEDSYRPLGWDHWYTGIGAEVSLKVDSKGQLIPGSPKILVLNKKTSKARILQTIQNFKACCPKPPTGLISKLEEPLELKFTFVQADSQLALDNYRACGVFGGCTSEQIKQKSKGKVEEKPKENPTVNKPTAIQDLPKGIAQPLLDYGPYRKELQTCIHSKWKPSSDRTSQAVVVWKMTKKGELLKDSIKVISASSDLAKDNALKALELSSESCLSEIAKLLPTASLMPETIMVDFTFTTEGSRIRRSARGDFRTPLTKPPSSEDVENGYIEILLPVLLPQR